ncbi:MAG: uracil-DNA glycosylase [Pseudomonadota bacterium]
MPNTAAEFVAEIAALKFSDTFNPYSSVCAVHDLTDAQLIRQRNLTLALAAAMRDGVDSLWIARDLGHRGGRRTGLALTDDVHLEAHAQLCGAIGLERATKGPPMAEATARVIWRALKKIDKRVFLWNVFPLHPHECGDSFSNRKHKQYERQQCERYIAWLVSTLNPRMIVAIGNDAAYALEGRSYKCVSVRHPSYGGQTQFLKQIGQLYRVNIA